MTDSASIIEVALSQYSILERLFKHLDYETTKHMASLRAAWQPHAQRRTDESDVKCGEFLSSDRLDQILTKMESTAGPPSVVFFFGVSDNPDFRCRLEEALQSRDNALWEKTTVVVARCYFRFTTKDPSLPMLEAVSYLALPAGVPVSALTKADFCALKNAGSDMDRNFLVFTDEHYECPLSYYKMMKRKLNPDVKWAEAAGGHYGEVWCKVTGEFSLKRFAFLVIAVSSVPNRLAVRLGRTFKRIDRDKAPLSSNPTSALVFPCVALEGRDSKFRENMAINFPALTSLVGGFTGGEWFGEFCRVDLRKGEDAVMSKFQQSYKFFFAAFTSL